MAKMNQSMINKEYMRWVVRAWRYRLRTEKQEIYFLLNHLKPGQTVLDIGAHKGAYTYWMSNRVGELGRVIAFEPQPRLNAYLSLIAKKAPIKNIHVESLALSSKEGNATMGVPQDNPSPSASLNQINGETALGITVKTTTLDDYVQNHDLSSIDLIKCDVEGHELDVFKSGYETLTQYKPVVMLECEARHNGTENVNAVFKYFRNLNYDGCFFDGKSFSSLDEFDLETYQTGSNRNIYVNNFFFTPKSK